MKRILVILSALFVALSVSAKTPNNDLIFANINDVNSPFYYPNLMLRYKEGKVMSEEEYHHLYYGYAFQPSYKPLEVNSAMNLTVVLQMLGVGLLLTLVASMASVSFIMRYDPLKILANRD